ncbi:sigma-70 family RNA polymerase sigma factor [Hyalangium rubrum]|uniref:Sigma-70 family RNA polymerase sigma factor n=1 Tax=Hyalangium rubrum TaxID=3103134 RepID=A0ABU5HFW8_9BACT|nr:sigma-70 family RNA polymerase sigma factor [Hyalangium sp. s54d21]MDY7232141.1 sigma-70 family RNA polymerase sigma factor [Hyalangium sp. s54d21]
MLANARAAWPGLNLPEATFLRYLAERLPEEGSLLDALRRLHVTDLYLACACTEGLAAAQSVLDTRFLPKVDAAVARVEGSGNKAAEVRQRLRERLLISEDGRPPPLAGYQGTGPLVAWLRAAAVRTALNLRRSERRRARVEEEVLSEGPVVGGDLELDYLRQKHRVDFQAALAEALAALPARERTVLRLHFVEGLSLERIGAMYQTHKSTVSRWLARAREEVLAEVRRRLAERLQLSAEELQSLLRAIRSQLDASLSQLLPRSE